MDGSKSGRLGYCDTKGCISSQANGEDPNYVPWVLSFRTLFAALECGTMYVESSET